ncbi:VirB4-like conjugal transfer ATPase, CD1110 family [Clostridium sp.]|uniref:VirB4-like conjugal transfer ATPase, CD1110 family n=1 Tax=Clostridium sp. TaxID=1506 RepID=UPI0028FEA456|nr:DUF87 domain-containing protein [Clostridium sp.]MDU2155272.1 ATP-binding protein [Clostridium sp.]
MSKENKAPVNSNLDKQIRNMEKKKEKNDSLFYVLKECCKLKWNEIVKKEKRKPVSSQDTIPYQRMFQDGICKIDKTHFNKMIYFNDINYRLAHKEEKNAIFNEFCSFLNYFDHSVKIQLAYMNEFIDMEKETKTIEIELQDDGFDDLREEYQEMLNRQLRKGNNGLVKRRYIIFTVEAKNLKEARGKLSKIEIGIMNNLKTIGVSSYVLDGNERLEVLYHILNEEHIKLDVNWEAVKQRKISTKDYIAPEFFNFYDKRTFNVGHKVGQSLQMIILAPELSDRALADFLDLENEAILSFHVQSIDQQKAIKYIKHKLTDLESMKIEEQKKAIRAGYDMDVIPADINTYIEDTKNILRDLQSRNERWYQITVVATTFAKTLPELQTNVFHLQSVGQQYNCLMKPFDNEQENCFMACLPLGVNRLYPKRGLTTSALAVFIPFTSQELYMSGNSLYYGINALSNNMIMADRRQLKNPNGLILGVPGSGKSFSSKREIFNVFLTTHDSIYILDPEGEYSPVVQMLKGQVVKISSNSSNYINPLDINMDYSEDESPVTLKADFVMSLMELICAKKEGLAPIEKTYIDKCVPKIYQKYMENPKPENMPILEDLWNELKKLNKQEATELADALEIYVKGSLQIFNHRTNVDIHNRLVCFDIKELGKNLKKLGMLIVQDQVWNRVTKNRNNHVSTWYYIDEMHLLLKEEQTAAYTTEIWKRFRKWGGIPTGMTQNVKDFLKSPEIESIFDNSSFIYLLSQAPGDKEILSKKFNISDSQLKYVTNSQAGEGLIIFEGMILPFIDHFPKNTKMYKAMTTKPEEVANKSVNNESVGTTDSHQVTLGNDKEKTGEPLVVEIKEELPKKKRGRPKKETVEVTETEKPVETPVKKKRGRPKKVSD